MKTNTRMQPSLVRKRIDSILLSTCMVLMPLALGAQFDLNFECTENRTVEVTMKGTVDSIQATMTVVGDTSLIDSILVEIAVKGNPVFWDTATIVTSAGEVVVIPFPGIISNTGSNEEAAIYRAWVRPASTITVFTPVVDTLHYDDWQSLTLFEVTNGGECLSGSTSGGDLLIFHFCDSLFFVLDSVSGPTKDVHVVAPLSEIGDADTVRSAIVSINAVHEGVITNISIDTLTGLDNTGGANALLFERTFQLDGDVDTVLLIFISPDGVFPPFTSCTQYAPFGGDSFIIGTVVVSSSCDECCQVQAECDFADILLCTFDSIPEIPVVFLDSMVTYTDTVNLDSLTFLALGGTYTTTMCDTVYIQAMDSVIGSGCGTDTAFVSRYYIFYSQSSGAPLDTCTQIFIVVDAEPPAITCPSNLTLECTESTDPGLTGVATASDNCGGVIITYTEIIIPGSCPQQFTILRTWSAIDDCGQVSTCVQSISVDDSTPPLIACPNDLTLECGQSTDPADTGIATATDNCGEPSVTYSESIAAGSCTAEFTITRTWIAADSCGNIATCVQTISVEDTTPPVISCPEDLTLECDASEVLIDFDGVIAPELFEDQNEPVETYAGFGLDFIGTWEVLDITSFSVTGLSAPNKLAWNTNLTGLVEEIIFPIPTSGITFKIAYSTGGPTVTVDAYDANDNLVESQIVLVDSVAATISIVEGNIQRLVITVENSSAGCMDDLTFNAYPPTATDNCDVEPVVTYTEELTPGSCSNAYVITRIWSAEDECGNISTCVQTIVVDDTTPPVISCPSNITLECGASTDPADTGTATATDNCDNESVVTFTDNIIPGGCDQQFTIERTWTATDACGNTTECIQTINVADTTPPELTCPSNSDFDCTTGAPFFTTLTEFLAGGGNAFDNCALDSASFTLQSTTSTGTCPVIYTFLYTITDLCGNLASCVHQITVTDDEPPVLICPATVTVQCEDDLPPALTSIEAFVAAGGIVSDNCSLDSAAFVVIADFSDQQTCPETQTRVYQVSDFCGNVSTCTHTILIHDTIAPVLVCLPDLTLDCSDVIPEPEVVITDNCDTDPQIFPSSALVPGSCPHEFTIFRSWTAVDECGNSGSCTQIITFLDMSPPEISCPPDVTLQPGESIDPADTGEAIATDNCDGEPTITYSDSDGGCVIVRTWSAEDACGNVSTCDQLLFIGTGPFILVCPDDVTVSCLTDLDSIPGIPDEMLECGEVTITYFDDLIYAGECDSAFMTKYTRTYFAVDETGNTTTCTQMIFFEALELEDVDFPPDLKGVEALPCFPPPDTSPAATGVPEIDGVPIVNGQVCNLSATYSDVVVPLCSGGYKIFRTWLVTDWCDGNATLDSVQIIEVADLTPPVVNAPDSVFAMAGMNCLGDVVMPPAEVTEDCSGTFTVRMQGSFGTIFGNGGTIEDLPVGVHTVIYIATNTCTLEGRDTTIVIVTDDGPPTAICNASVVVPLNSMGMALVAADAFDAGSNDNCGPVYFKVKRMDVPSGFECFVDGNPEYLFDDFIKFCCEDIGNTNLMVILRVYDTPPVPGPVSDEYLQGHFADCMVQVEIQDKIPPELICPSDLTISCMFAFDPEDLSIFGEVVTDPAERQEICIDDIGNPNTFGLTCIGLDGLATDNCHLQIVEEEPAFDIHPMCGTGTIVRTFTATDDGGLSASCQQRITIINFTPFQEGDIIWPPDYETADICDVDLLNPEDLPPPYNAPVVNDDECELVTFTHKDIVFDFSGSHQACFKILRTWTVLDWCQYEAGAGSGIWSMTQVIKVHNTTGPNLVLSDEELSVCSNDPQCGPGEVILEASATDDCSGPDALRWNVAVDINNDHSLDQTYLNLSGGSIELTVELPIGLHRVLYSVEDLCGNQTTEEQFITVLSCKPPSAKCRNLTTTLMPMDTDGDQIPDWGMVTLWATDLDAGSDHACGNPVTVAFSADVNDTFRVFDCDNLGENAVELWVIDDNGNTDFCIVTVTIQDNFESCPENIQERAVISGSINTAYAEAVPEVEVYLDGSTLPFRMTDTSGGYIFPPMPHGGAYEVRPYLNREHKKGVSTLDLISLQKHLLGLKELDDPYKFIAADANRSNSLSAMDIVTLRRMILGITDTLMNNTSWRFVDAAYVFADPSNPLEENFPETYQIPALSGDMVHLDFVAVKIGDINGSAMSGLTGDVVDVRSAIPRIAFYMQDKVLRSGETVAIDIFCRSVEELEVLQTTLQWNPDLIDVTPVSALAMVDEVNWNAEACAQGKLPISWTSLDVHANAGKLPFLRLQVTARHAVRLGEAGLKFGDEMVETEAVLNNGRWGIPELTVLPLTEAHERLIVYQNRPNPFQWRSLIPVVLPEENMVSIEIFTMDGVLVYQNNVQAQKGYHEFMVESEALGGSGVYTCKISTATEYRTLRMIVVGE